MSQAKIFFNEMLVGIRNYQDFIDFCNKYHLWNPKGTNLNWNRQSYFLTKMAEYTDKRYKREAEMWRLERERIVQDIKSSATQLEIDRKYAKWSQWLGKLALMRDLPLFEVFDEYIYYLVSFNGTGGLRVDPNWTVLLNPKFLEGLELIDEPEERVILSKDGDIPIFLIGDSFGIVSENGTAFSDPRVDAKLLHKFLELWQAGEVELVGNVLQPTADFARKLAFASTYNEGRVTKVRTHWRKQRYGRGRGIRKRILIWEHPMRLPDRNEDVPSIKDEHYQIRFG